jgi:heat-inducible transcriptional repressor
MQLTKREKLVLDALIQNFIINAAPVSSSLIAKKKYLGMSPASVRSILAELEKKGYIYQPHTSAGRVPVTQGYRLYVDALMKQARLSPEEKKFIQDSIQTSPTEFEDVMREATRILAHLSHQLGISLSPKMDEGIFQRMELVKLSSDRILVVISIKSGIIKTITLEIQSEISKKKLELVNNILNERLSGLEIGDIRKLFSEIIQDINEEEGGLLKVLANDADRVFDFDENKELFYMGTRYIVEQPEFADIQKFTPVVELLETPNIMVQLLDEGNIAKPYTIKIGEEIKETRMQQCSIITTRYQIGNISGTLGLIGPMRMNYSKLVSLVEYIAKAITDKFHKN